MWLTQAPWRPYHTGYIRRGWYQRHEFATGTCAGWGAHTMDAAYWSLQLGPPETVEAELDPEPVHQSAYPKGAIVTYRFPARGKLPPVKLVYYLGTRVKEMPRPEHLEKERSFNTTGGQLIIGQEASILAGTHAQSARIIPEKRMQEVGRPEPKYERAEGGHFGSWLLACRGGKPALSRFEYAGPLNEVCLLGTIANLTGRRIEWDAANMRIGNDPDLDQMVHGPAPRQGWDF
jgi:hypothetical protein